MPHPDLHSRASPAAAADDSVPIDGADAGAGAGKGPRLRVANLKLLVALFLIFVVVVSDIFTNSIIAGFGSSAVRCRNPTSWGVVLQGIFLVIGYTLMVYLAEQGIL